MKHYDQLVEIDREMDGKGIICFALNEISESKTALDSAVIGEFSVRELSYILNTLKKRIWRGGFYGGPT